MATAIPASEPVTAQTSFTVTADVLLTLASTGKYECATGSNLTASTRVMQFKIYKNTVLTSSGAQECRASQAWSYKLRSSIGAVLNDVIAIKFWTSNAAWLDIDDSEAPPVTTDYATTEEAIAYAIALG